MYSPSAPFRPLRLLSLLRSPGGGVTGLTAYPAAGPGDLSCSFGNRAALPKTREPAESLTAASPSNILSRE